MASRSRSKERSREKKQKKMSCCGGNCGCGSDCKCGDGCNGCKMFPDLASGGEGRAEIRIAGVAPQHSEHRKPEWAEMNRGDENEGCKCGNNCTCNPCNCNSYRCS